MKLIDIKQLNSDFLIEGRIDTIKQLYSAKLQQKLSTEKSVVSPDTFIEYIITLDPTKNKQYVQWILNQFISNNVKREDLYKVKNDLVLFEKHKNQIQQKDINKYDVKSLSTAVDNVNPEQLSNKQQKQQIKLEGADKILEGPDCTIIKLKTKEAARFYGANTKWCTAAEDDDDNMFDDYNAQAPLYVAICKDGRKYQFFIDGEDSQYMDEQDEHIDTNYLMRKYPTISDFFKNYILYKTKSGQYLKDPDMAVSYAVDVMQSRVPEIEPVILKDINASLEYARNLFRMGERWPEFEKLILKSEDSNTALHYATWVIKGRWPEAEKIIMKTPNCAYWYARDRIKGRWIEAEPYIKTDKSILKHYILNVVQGPLPELGVSDEDYYNLTHQNT